MCAIACQSATMLVLCSNVTVSVNKFTCASVRLEWSFDQLGRHISIVIIIIIIDTNTKDNTRSLAMTESSLHNSCFLLRRNRLEPKTACVR